MADRWKIVIVQIRHFTNIFFVFFIKRKHELIIILVSFKKKHRKILWKMPNLRDDHLPLIGHLNPVYPRRNIIINVSLLFYRSKIFFNIKNIYSFYDFTFSSFDLFNFLFFI
jgi:hypothetical protein